MAKMFYTLEEAAEKLGVDEQAIKDMAARNELQQFRDGDKLMFKRDQVDAKATGDASDDSMLELADSGIADAIDLKEDTASTSIEAIDPNEATGVSVFDAGEISSLADPMAQTQVTGPLIDDEELALESVGSGSGLLDLTRESDDTSLGAELLDEIYPGNEGGSATGISMESAVGSSGIFDGDISMETGQVATSEIDNLGAQEQVAPAQIAQQEAYEEAYDPAGSFFGAGMLFGVMIAVIIGLAAILPSMYGVEGTLINALVPLENGKFVATNVYALAGGVLVLSFVFGFVGMFIGKSSAR